MSDDSSMLARVLASAARLQEVVPDAVLVGGSAAAYYAAHRESFDHDHVLEDLVERYDEVLEAVEATDGWATSTTFFASAIISAWIAGVSSAFGTPRSARTLTPSALICSATLASVCG